MVGVEEGENLCGIGYGQELRESESVDGSFGRLGHLGEVLDFEQFHLVQSGVVGEGGEGALQVVQAHQAVAQVDVGFLEFELLGGLDGLVETLPFGTEGVGISAELGIEHLAAASGRHKLHAINDVLETCVLFYKFFYFHIFFTS